MRRALKIDIDLDNAAFDDAPMSEAARILRELADAIEGGSFPEPLQPLRLRDVNGNHVGNAAIVRRR